MPVLQIEHPVRDFASWKEAFDADPVGRERGGVRRSLREPWGRAKAQGLMAGPQARIVDVVETVAY